jgi:hypothetical protein
MDMRSVRPIYLATPRLIYTPICVSTLHVYLHIIISVPILGQVGFGLLDLLWIDMDQFYSAVAEILVDVQDKVGR